MLRRAFTLVELLVVILVIALLLALLLPILGSSRESARRTICASQMKQWHLVMEHYAGDYREWYPGIWFSQLNHLAVGMTTHPDIQTLADLPTYIEAELEPGIGWRHPSTELMETYYGLSAGIRRCPSVNEPLSKYPSFEMGQYGVRTDYFAWFGRAINSDDPMGYDNNSMGWSIGNSGGWSHIIGFSRYGVVQVPEYWGPTWNKRIERESKSILLMDRHFVKVDLAVQATNQPTFHPSVDDYGATSNHGRKVGRQILSGTAYQEYAAGANSLSHDGSFYWHNFSRDERVYPLSYDTYHMFYSGSRDYVPEASFTKSWPLRFAPGLNLTYRVAD